MTTPLIPLGATAVISASTAPVMGTINRYNAAGGNRSTTLPALSGLRVGARVVVEKDTLDVSTNTVTVSRAGSDLFDDGTTSVVLTAPGQKLQLQVMQPAGTKVWKVVGGHTPAAMITAAVNALLNGAPGALNTLKELADALNDDANFAATVTTALAGKQPSDATLTALSGVATAADRLIYATDSDAFAATPFTAAGRALVDDADAAAQRTTLGAAASVADWTSGLASAQTDQSIDQVIRDRVSILRFIPKALHAAILARTSTTDVSSYVNNAITSGEQLFVPRGRYAVSGVKLIGETDIQAARSALFIPAANSAAMFYTENVAFNAAKHQNIVWEGGRITNPNNATGVTGFDLPEWRHGSLLHKIPIDGGKPSNGMIGVRLRRLNWNSTLRGVEVANCDNAFLLEMGAACIDILGCIAIKNNVGWFLNGIDTTDSVTGIVFGPVGGTPITQISIRQGVCQQNTVGVKLRSTFTTRLEKMHFEYNGTDIDADGDVYGLVEDCEFAGNNVMIASNGGTVTRPTGDTTSAPVLTKGIKLRNTVACEIRNPTMYGTRQLGFWDVPAGNTRTIASKMKCATTGTLVNSPLGDINTVATARANSTAYALGALVSNSSNLYYCIGAGTSAASGGPTTTAASIADGTVTWTYAGPVPTVNRVLGDVTGLMYGCEEGYYQALSSNIDLDRPIYGYVRTVTTGGISISLSNKGRDGRRVRLILRGASTVTDNSPVRVDGKLVATFMAADANKNTVVDIEVCDSLAAGPVITVASTTHSTGSTD